VLTDKEPWPKGWFLPSQRTHECPYVQSVVLVTLLIFIRLWCYFQIKCDAEIPAIEKVSGVYFSIKPSDKENNVEEKQEKKQEKETRTRPETAVSDWRGMILEMASLEF
jgi:hypothetical protein